MPNLQALEVFYGTIPLIAIFLIGVWSNNKRLDDLRSDMNRRFEQIGAPGHGFYMTVEERFKKIEDNVLVQSEMLTRSERANEI